MKLSHVSYILTPLLFTFSAFEAVADSSADNDSTNVAREVTGNELSYDSMISSHNQLKCLYGVALIEGRGVVADRQQGIAWLKKASLEGVIDADEYLTSMDIKPSGQG